MSPSQDLEAVKRAFSQAAQSFAQPPEPLDAEVLPGRRRSIRLDRAGRDVVLTLVTQQVDGDTVLRVEEGLPVLPLGTGRRRGPGAAGLGGDVLLEQPLAALERNQIGSALTALDRNLTPRQELRVLAGNKLERATEVRTDGRILLLVHGTFSRGEMFLEATQSPDFLAWATARYDQVLSWDHPTLSVSPAINARRLALALAGTEKAEIDVLCHSRGGLVTRWWLEAFDRGPVEKRRVVFVGCPLEGTGLAAPPRLKGALSLIANFGKALGEAGRFVPFASFVTGVFQIVSSVTSLVAKTPALDAAVALIPGLSGQSRVGNNFELLALRERLPGLDRYFAVRSNFESEAVGWRFWRVFRDLPGRIASSAADLVFEGPNDLVVDSGSMVNLADRSVLPKGQVLDFGTNDRVHHCNYFDQPETIEFIRSKLV